MNASENTSTRTHADADAHAEFTNWAGFVTAEPAFAETVESRFRQFRHQALATLKADGSPRVTGIEVSFRFEEMWLGMMPRSRKAHDLQRDPRFSVLTNPGSEDTMTGDGDIRISGRVVEVEDPAMHERFAGETEPPGPFHLFKAELSEVVRTSVEGEKLVIRVWRPGAGLRTIRRGNDDSPSRED